ncbi:hypothetical protein OQA88_10406 [Cercophora sp. LCS_1]
MPPRGRAYAEPASLKEIAGLLVSSSATTRKEAVENLLTHFKTAERATQPKGVFDDKTYHSIYEALFRCTLLEKEVYFGTQKKATKTSMATSASRLEKCAEALRLAVRHGANRIKRKTARAIIDHITQVLPGPEDTYIAPLLKDYIKALSTFLDVPANVESLSTLSGEGWEICADFCVEALSRYLETGDRESGSGSRGSPAPGSTSRSKSVGVPQATNNQIGGQLALELLLCLESLVSSPNAPVLRRADKVSGVVLAILQLRQMKIGELQKAALSAITHIFCRVQAEDVALTKKLTRSLVPLLSYWWQPRSLSRDAMLNSIRDEMLKTIYAIHLYLEALLREAPDDLLREDTEELIDALWSEYSRREERARLLLDDLSFSGMRLPEGHPCTAVSFLRPFNQSAEQNWALLENLAILEAIFSRTTGRDHALTEPEVDQPRKRRRVVSNPNRLHQKMLSQDPAVQLTSLQLIPFLLKLKQLSLEETTQILADVARCMPAKQNATASWGMLAYASVAAHEQSRDSSLSSQWKQIWQQTVRSLSLPSVTRAACVLLKSMLKAELVIRQELSEDLTLMITTADISGPAVLVDSSLTLMSTLLRLRNILFPNASQATASHITRWVFVKWNPVDSAFASTHAEHATPFDIVSLLRVCAGLPPLYMAVPLRVFGGSISQFWLSQRDYNKMARYLLLLGDEDAPAVFPSSHQPSTVSSEQRPEADQTESHATKKLISELIFPKIQETLQMTEAWQKRGGENIAPISADRLRSVFAVSLAGLLLLQDFANLGAQTCQELGQGIFGIIDASLKAALSSPDSESYLNTILRLASCYLPPLDTEQVAIWRRERQPLVALVKTLSQVLRDKEKGDSPDRNPDDMDIDDEFDSQTSQSSAKLKGRSLARRDIWLGHTPEAFYLETSLRIHLLDIVRTDEGSIGRVPEEFAERLVHLPKEQFLQCRLFMNELFTCFRITPWDSQALILERVGVIIGEDQLACCEVSLVTCIDTLGHFTSSWTDDTSKDDPLPGLGGDLYWYLVKNALSKNIMSAATQVSFSKLLFKLIETSPSYAATLKLPSSRSTLFNILQDGPMEVKFFIGRTLPTLFGWYVLKTHDAIFVDVLEKLPTDSDDSEGIAFRLWALAELACSWPTLLRRCIYHIFETPGKIAQSARYATSCVERLSRTLGLDNPKELFSLFAPQILYTWLENDPIEEIPFAIFGFSSLQDLLLKARTEAVAILIMRGQEKEALDLAGILGISAEDMIQQSFTKIMAYSIAHDISVPANTPGHVAGETRVRKILGNEKFFDNIQINLADIVATFFDIFDQEDPIERAFGKDERFKYAEKIMAQIKEYGFLDADLPPNQQPMFKAKYLHREILHLYSRTNIQLGDIWTPALIVFVARSLLNTIHPALGPLHACSVLRKIRVLICMAGDKALSSYPLEMLLYSTRDFFLDPECADDALGIAKYLIIKGEAHLTKVPSFFAGYALTSFADLRIFIESSQSSTTQESQFKATKSKAQDFHDWFRKYLLQYVSPFSEAELRRAFQAITKPAASYYMKGTAEKDDDASNLLLEILKDWNRDKQLLNEPSRSVAFSMLCGQFKEPPASQRDIIGTDEEAMDYAAAVWRSCSYPKLSDEYMSWAGRVLGRSFAACGEVPQGLLRESQLEEYRRLSPGNSGSGEAILTLLQALTTSSHRRTAGLAEAALRAVVTDATTDEDPDLLYACSKSLSISLQESSNWDQYLTPKTDYYEVEKPTGTDLFAEKSLEHPKWAQQVTTLLAMSAAEVPMLRILPPILTLVKGFAEKAFPFVAHLALANQLEGSQAAKRMLSDGLKKWLTATSPAAKENQKLLLNTILYLRTQRIGRKEGSIADRNQWLEVSLPTAAATATRCGMNKVALLFAELAFSESARASRRSSAANTEDATEVLLDIFENIDDPDAYYGLEQDASLGAVRARLEYENDGSKSLAFRGAEYDTHLRNRAPMAGQDANALIRSLSNLGLAGLSNSLLEVQQATGGSSSSLDAAFTTARRLEKWNLPAPAHSENWAVTVYKAYQGLNQAADSKAAKAAIYEGLANTVRQMTSRSHNPSSLRHQLGALATLTELDDLVDVSDNQDLKNILKLFEKRTKWMMSKSYDDVSQVLSCRETSLSIWSKDNGSRPPAVSKADARLFQVRGMLLAADVYRFHRAHQETLNLSTRLTSLIRPSEILGLGVDAAIQVEAANALWDQGEMISSIRMLQSIDKDGLLKRQMVAVSRSDLLSKIGHQISVARLESPDSIQKKYLEPALKELRGRNEGVDSGRVFHQFAMFCDSQLQNPDNLEDLARLQHLKKGKSEEVHQLKALMASSRDSQQKHRYASHLAKAKQWLDLDEQELRRMEQTRAEFVRLCLENYMLSLAASDEHNNDSLRFTALWLERSEEDSTNETVKKHISKVPTRKLAPLMNQLSSRLQDHGNAFQKTLIEVIFRICVEHPYHGMYQIWSGARSRVNKDDEVAVSRQRATDRISKALVKSEKVSTVWPAIDQTNRAYHALAVDRDPNKYKQGARMAMKDVSAAYSLQSTVSKYKIPPPTMQIGLSATLDYSNVPLIQKFEPEMTIAGGVSAPKIITAVGTDGKRYKQLVKGGNDDLRQDAIMEQVFAAVSELLKLHRTTRQRNLGIRTYKVLPLTASSGLIEFVPDTIPLHEYLMPAHEKYYPKDLKGSQCRKEISNAQTKSTDTRVSVYRKVTDKFHPVMRYFFMEHFPDPDEWFARRTNYTRTTAAISMLGHVLGLGDRHGHNILLDKSTGEVVHIDLGVAFEMGRVLPVPELVPFRLTRDIVDGMGITKTEGVFRRCCEFTLDALREETYSIMTILDVLRYDPLYSWSISPVRMAKLQNARGDDEMDEQADVESKRNANEPSEADRALEVVRKKLSKTLSVMATVNDLINQATDERNLAVLYSGWAAYA